MKSIKVLLSSGNRSYLLLAIAFLAFLWSITFFWVVSVEEGQERRNRVTVQANLYGKRTTLENQIDNLLFMPKAISAYAIAEGKIDSVYFTSLAADMAQRLPYFINISLAPDNVAQFIFPYEGNEKVIGFNFLSHPVQKIDVERAITSKMPVLSGPLDLVQGGKGLILRYPIYLNFGNGEQETYWGMASLVINYDKFVNRLIELSMLSEDEMSLLIRHSESEEGTLLYGPRFRESEILETQRILVSPQDWFELQTQVPSGWSTLSVGMYLMFISAFLLEGLLALFLFFSLARQKELKVSLQKNAALNERLQRTNQFQVRLYSIIAHDLRGPIRNMSNLVDLLGTDNLSAQQAEELREHVRQSSNSLLTFSESLLNWASSQLNEYSFEPTNVSARSILEEAMSVLTFQSVDKLVSYTVSVDDSLLLYGDRNMLLVIMRNLLSNAIKYSPKGGEVMVEMTQLSAAKTEIRITDRGKGMDPSLIPRILRGQTVSSVPGTMGEKGTGFGLLLCKEFTEIHQGKLDIETGPSGTTVRVTLPFVYIRKIAETSSNIIEGVLSDV